jgi:hypothetical protein
VVDKVHGHVLNSLTGFPPLLLLSLLLLLLLLLQLVLML